ncbi:MAG: response regulator, partial [Leptospiraceae bacterium]|nr:response regulator [Leptospiraceae bacterium]
HMMNGDIKAQNNSEGGASFIFYLPMRTADKTDATDKNQGHHLGPRDATGRHWQLLLAEDTEENALLIKAFLKKYPCDVTHVHNGQEALEAVQSSVRFDLVLMDIEMPVMDGLTATRAIRDWEASQAERQAVPITALTAHALNHFKQKGYEAGCSSYLSKPIRKQQLIEFLAEHLQAAGQG